MIHPKSSIQMVNVTLDFDFPYVEGNPIDTCVTTAGQCGKPAADFFCRFQKCWEAVSYVESTGDRGPTYVQGEGKVREKGGNSFDKVTCSCLVPAAPPAAEDPAAQVVYEAPKILDHPVDVCLSKKNATAAAANNSCGKPAADAFCESFGSKESVAFVEQPGPAGGPTWLIGDHALNTIDPRTFTSITCV